MTPSQPSSASSRPRSSTPPLLFLAILCLALAVLALRARQPFQWRALAGTFRSLSVVNLVAGVAAIYAGYGLRALRWSLLLDQDHRPPGRFSAFSTLSPQLIGFTVTTLFGRAADLARPWLIARRLRTSLATQLAVYAVERVLDLAAAAVLIASSLLLPKHDDAGHVALVRTASLALVGVLGLLAAGLTLRLAGDALPSAVGRVFGGASPRLADALPAAIRDFQAALRQIGAARLLAAAAVSLLMWTGIAASYLLSAHACRATATLAGLSFAGVMPILAVSLGGSLLQLPVLGWFTQAALLAAALHTMDGVALAPATACGVIIVAVTSLSVLPLGFAAARAEGLPLRDISREAGGAT